MFFNFGIRDNVNWYPCGLITTRQREEKQGGKEAHKFWPFGRELA
jgi:hypothetical protein